MANSDPVSRTSRITIALIIDSAQEVLVTKGYVGFTTRAVAEAAGISQGNLGYHFKTKQDLLRAVIAHLVESISDRFTVLLQGLDTEDANAIDQLVRNIWAATTSDRTVRIFREIWSIALHDPLVKEAIDDLYDDLMESVAAMLRRFYPDSDAQSLKECVQLLAIFSEGTSVLYGTRGDRAVSQDRIVELVSELLDAVAKGDAPKPFDPG